MSIIKNLYVKDEYTVFTPVYMQGEQYSFFINSSPLTDPDFANFRLQIWDVDGNVIHSNVGALSKVTLYENEDIYRIYCIFYFPYISEGTYNFAIYDIVNNVLKVKSNPILVAGESASLATILRYRNEDDIYDFNYEDLPNFYNKIRVVLSLTDEQFETDRTQYRNVTDRKLRTLVSYRDNYIKVECYKFDIDAHKAMSAVLQHSLISLNGRICVVKTDYNIDTNNNSKLSKATFEVYPYDDDDSETGSFYEGYGELIIICGDESYNPELIYQNN